MTGRLAHMSAEELSKLVDYLLRYEAGNKTVGDVKQELGLTNEEYNDLYTLAMPAIRGRNEGYFWRVAYRLLEDGICNALAGKKSIDKKMEMIADILKRRSLSKLKEERLKGWEAA